MPNIGTVLKDEIVRLSRRATRSQVDPARKAAAQHRRDIASLKRQVAQLERQVAALTRKVLAGAPASSPASTGKNVRFVAKGLRSQRKRLGLSAEEFGKLFGVSPQSIYNWEQGVTRPREQQIAKLVALRTIGKREALQRLKQLAPAKPKTRRKRKG